ncbi:hypothetical protein Acr_00g0072490 [Actinidia rufa]|uniref:Uncharacterized protein n=1 Tax=Actinidia rufa TaxID=165716 RepID=A0A7J0DRV9_9ERIC|nr:hypothetical protein Acr_00g0072490 [Actinidia rufa]
MVLEPHPCGQTLPLKPPAQLRYPSAKNKPVDHHTSTSNSLLNPTIHASSRAVPISASEIHSPHAQPRKTTREAHAPHALHASTRETPLPRSATSLPRPAPRHCHARATSAVRPRQQPLPRQHLLGKLRWQTLRMAQAEVSQPISIGLDESNYRLWSLAMQRFLRARKLWKYITGSVQPPHFSETDDDEDDDLHAQFQSQLEDWDSVNSKIITWFSNTSVSSIHSLFTPFETAKEVWDYLAERYSSVDGANEYQLGLELHHLRFDPGQTLTEFYNKMSNLWNHLAQFEPTWTCPTDAAFSCFLNRLLTTISSLYCHSSHGSFSWLFLLIMSIYGLLFYIAILFLQLAKLLPNSDMRRLARRLWFINILSLFWQHLSWHHLWPPPPPSSSQPVWVPSSKNIYHLVLRRNIVIFVDETLTLMKTVALAPDPNARGTTTVRLLLSLILLDHLLILRLPPLLPLMSRP